MLPRSAAATLSVAMSNTVLRCASSMQRLFVETRFMQGPIGGSSPRHSPRNFRRRRKIDRHSRTRGCNVFDIHSPVVFLDNFLDNGKTQASAFFLASHIRLERAIEQRFGKARAIVLDFEQHSVGKRVS